LPTNRNSNLVNPAFPKGGVAPSSDPLKSSRQKNGHIAYLESRWKQRWVTTKKLHGEEGVLLRTNKVLHFN